MTTLKERQHREQQTYLDMVTASEPFRRVVMADRINARAELVSLRAEVERWKQNCRVLNKTGDELRAELTTATRTAEVWERQHKEIVAELDAARQEILQLSAGEYLLREIGAALGCAPTSDILKRIAEQAAQIEAMDLERGELMLARDYARDEA